MSKQLIIHILEFTLSFIYVMLIWPVYEGEDYLWGCFICISYIIIIASYCIMRSLLPAMKIACDVYDIPTHTWKKLFFANIPWCAFALFISLVFQGSLGYFACLPIVVPNGICLLFQLLIFAFNCNNYRYRRQRTDYQRLDNMPQVDKLLYNPFVVTFVATTFLG